MKINLPLAAAFIALVYLAPQMFKLVLGIVAAVVLLAMYLHRDIVIATFREEREKKQAEARRKELEILLTQARQALAAGDEQPMRVLAEDYSVADAWCALAQAYGTAPPQTRDDAAITNAYLQACRSQHWVGPRVACEFLYEYRYFHGLGIDTDYDWLVDKWTEYGGHGHAIELAWIHALGPQKLRDYEIAAKWLYGSLARQSTPTSDFLSPDAVEQLIQTIHSKVPEKVRKRLESDARADAYREFVAGR